MLKGACGMRAKPPRRCIISARTSCQVRTARAQWGSITVFATLSCAPSCRFQFDRNDVLCWGGGGIPGDHTMLQNATPVASEHFDGKLLWAKSFRRSQVWFTSRRQTVLCTAVTASVPLQLGYFESPPRNARDRGQSHLPFR